MENLKKSFKELKWYEYMMGAIMVFIAARAMAMRALGRIFGQPTGNSTGPGRGTLSSPDEGR